MDKFVRADKTNLDDLKFKDQIKLIQQMGKDNGVDISRSKAKEFLNNERKAKIYVNDTYQVRQYVGKDIVDIWHEPLKDCMDYLSIKRHDREIIRSWSDLQEIKNVICENGTERFAIEIYPPDCFLVNTANQYHLWVFPKGMDLPCGFRYRAEISDSGISETHFNGKTFVSKQGD